MSIEEPSYGKDYIQNNAELMQVQPITAYLAGLDSAMPPALSSRLREILVSSYQFDEGDEYKLIYELRQLLFEMYSEANEVAKTLCGYGESNTVTEILDAAASKLDFWPYITNLDNDRVEADTKIYTDSIDSQTRKSVDSGRTL